MNFSPEYSNNNTIDNNNKIISTSSVLLPSPPPPPPFPPPPPPSLVSISRSSITASLKKKSQTQLYRNGGESPETLNNIIKGKLLPQNSYQRYLVESSTSAASTMVGQQQQPQPQQNIFTNDLNQKIPINPKIATHIDTMQMYNIMQDIAIPKMIMDLRPREMYEKSHIKAAVSIPPPTVDEVGDEELNQFNMTKYLAEHCPVAKYWNLILSRVIIYTDESIDPETGNKLSMEVVSSHDHSDIYPLESRHPSVWFNFVLHYLISRSKKTSVCLYENGFQIFNQRYPFLCRGVTISNKAYRNIPESSLYPSEILEDFLYLGAYENASSRSQLDNLKITHIVNMASELEDVFPHLYKYYRADLDDNFKADITSHFVPINQFIDSAKACGGRVLVHCAMGISRSTTAVMAYLMKSETFDYNHARQFVKEKRSIIQPNFGFVKALKAYDELLQIQRYSTSEQQKLILGDSATSTSNFCPTNSIFITNNDGCIITPTPSSSSTQTINSSL